MKRYAAILGCAIVFLATAAPRDVPAQASPVEARTVMDMVVHTVPPDPAGHCFDLDRGTLDVSLTMIRDVLPSGVEFFFAGYRGSDQPATIMGAVTGERWSFAESKDIEGGTYCYSVTNPVPLPPDAGLATATNFDKMVRVQMVWRPRP